MAHDTRRRRAVATNVTVYERLDSAEITRTSTDAVEMFALKYVNLIRCNKRWAAVPCFRAHTSRITVDRITPIHGSVRPSGAVCVGARPSKVTLSTRMTTLNPAVGLPVVVRRSHRKAGRSCSRRWKISFVMSVALELKTRTPLAASETAARVDI